MQLAWMALQEESVKRWLWRRFSVYATNNFFIFKNWYFFSYLSSAVPPSSQFPVLSVLFQQSVVIHPAEPRRSGDVSAKCETLLSKAGRGWRFVILEQDCLTETERELQMEAMRQAIKASMENARCKKHECTARFFWTNIILSFHSIFL